MTTLSDFLDIEDAGEYQLVKNSIPSDIKDGKKLIVDRKKPLKIHKVGNPNPAKFIPEIPQWFLNKYTDEGDTILDPFCGSGTALVEANIKSRNSIGMDLNPLSVKISKAKATPIWAEILFENKDSLENNLPEEYNGANIPNFKNRDFWFTNESSEAIAELRKGIENIESDEIKNYFLVTLSEVIRKVSHVADSQVLPAKRPNHTEEKDWSFEETIEEFWKHLDKNIEAMIEYRKEARSSKGKAFKGDAREMSQINKIDHILTSPPYINAVHYVWANKLRLMQLGIVDDDKRLELRSQELGTERIPAEKYKKLGQTGYETIDGKISAIFNEEEYSSTINQEVARSAYQFFVDMEKHFRQAAEVLKPDGYYCLVMGQNTLCGVNVPTADFLVEIAENNGFGESFRYKIKLKNKGLSLKRNVEYADEIEFDEVIVLDLN